MHGSAYGGCQPRLRNSASRPPRNAAGNVIAMLLDKAARETLRAYSALGDPNTRDRDPLNETAGSTRGRRRQCFDQRLVLAAVTPTDPQEHAREAEYPERVDSGEPRRRVRLRLRAGTTRHAAAAALDLQVGFLDAQSA
jgi:hypothetical protein